MPADYGHIRATEGADGEEIDCFFGTEHDRQKVWVLDQPWPDTGLFDEAKVFLGYDNRLLVLRDYQRCFDDGTGAARVGGLKQMTLQQFKDWLIRGDHKRQVAA